MRCHLYQYCNRCLHLFVNTVVSRKYAPPLPCIFSAKSCRGIFGPRNAISPLRVETLTQSGSRSLWWNGSARTKSASIEPLNSIASLFIVNRSALYCLPRTRTACRNDWTRQLLRGSALLPRPSTLKLASLRLASMPVWSSLAYYNIC